jgi:ankyrin repeat protein
MKTSELLRLLKNQKFNDIKKQLTSIDESIDARGYTILMYATAHRDEEAIKFFLNNGANPFKTDNYGNSAFSIAFSQEMESVAKEFVQVKVISNKKLSEIDTDLIKSLQSQEKGEFAYYIASHICTKNSDLRDSLGISTEGAKTCYNQAKDYYGVLGEDYTSLLGAYEK